MSPPIHARNVGLMPCSLSPAIIEVEPSGDHNELWMWHDDPASVIEGLAMKVTDTSRSAAISLMPFL